MIRTVSYFRNFLLIVFTFIIAISCNEESVDLSEGKIAVVERVIDGDTFVLEGGQRVRLLGIDAPEQSESAKLDRDAIESKRDKETIKELGRLSTRYVKELVEGKEVILIKEPNYEDTDRYGRLLRYIYLEDGTFVNGKIVAEGYAEVYEKYPVSKSDELRKLQREARENKKGLWGDIEGLKNLY